MRSKNKIDPDECSHKYDDGHLALTSSNKKGYATCVKCGTKFYLPYYVAPKRIIYNSYVIVPKEKVMYKYDLVDAIRTFIPKEKWNDIVELIETAARNAIF